MTCEEAIAYIESIARYTATVTRDTMPALLEELGDPHKGLRFVHVAGTNGKGSTCSMLSAILGRAGYRTGLYISPYIRRFNERVQVDGQEIPDEALAELTELVRAAGDRVEARGIRRPTYFEFCTAIGFLWFQRRRCDVVVLEVGLGGRLDATNVIDCPDCAVICTIGLDHTDQLGNTLELIAAEKGGIIKPGGDVVLADTDPDVRTVIADICRERGAKLRLADWREARVTECSLRGSRFNLGADKDLQISLLGEYQVQNAVTAVTVCRLLREKGYKISDDALRQGLLESRWTGRFELLREAPVVLVDGAHNPQGAAALMAGLRALFPGKKCIFIAGMLADKDYAATVAEALPLAKAVYSATPHSKRALTSDKLAAVMRGGSASVTACESLTEALDKALAAAGPEDVICAFGSLYQVSDVKAYFGK